MESTNKLPENWVIDTEKEKDSPLMTKFREWFKSEIGFYSHYKFQGMKNGLLCVRSFANEGAFKIITLEQWNAFYFPWEPKQGENILISQDGENFSERVFAFKYKGLYYCEKLYCETELLGFKFAKHIPKESILQPLVDQLKSEAKKLGIEKVNITFE